MAVPYTFGSATTSIPLSQLDSNFATAITLGNTAVQLGNTITTLTGVTNLASSGALTLGSNGNTTAIYVDTSQNVGIGTTSPASRLDVTRTGSTAGITAHFTNGDNDAYIYNTNASICKFTGDTSGNYAWGISSFNAYVAAYTNGSERMRIDSNGKVLVGGTSVTNGAKFEVFFDGNALNGIVANDTSSASGTTYFYCSANGTNIGTIARVGATNAVVYNTTSDARLKSNIQDASPVLEKLSTVKVRQYDWTEGNLHQDYGFIAQEIDPILSGVVTKGKEEEDVWQLDYSRLTPHLVKAIQELKAINDTQAETINALTARVVALESK